MPSRSTSPSTARPAYGQPDSKPLIALSCLFASQLGLYEKPKGSRKQRKERKNKQKKVRGAKKYQPAAA